MKSQSIPKPMAAGQEAMLLTFNASEPMQPLEDVAHTRQHAIEESAYWRAERRAFAPGGELEDWLGAEADFDSAQSGNVMT